MLPARISVAALSTGLINWVGPHEGVKVKAQELLVLLDDSEARSQVAQSEAAVAQARARAELWAGRSSSVQAAPPGVPLHPAHWEMEVLDHAGTTRSSARLETAVHHGGR